MTHRHLYYRALVYKKNRYDFSKEYHLYSFSCLHIIFQKETRPYARKGNLYCINSDSTYSMYTRYKLQKCVNHN